MRIIDGKMIPDSAVNPVLRKCVDRIECNVDNAGMECVDDYVYIPVSVGTDPVITRVWAELPLTGESITRWCLHRTVANDT